MDRKMERTAKFNRNQKAKNKQKSKKYKKEKRELENDFKNAGLLRDTDKLKQGE